MLRAATDIRAENTVNRVYDFVESLEKQIAQQKSSIATQLQQAGDSGSVTADDVRATIRVLPEADALALKDRLRVVCTAGELTLKTYLAEG